MRRPDRSVGRNRAWRIQLDRILNKPAEQEATIAAFVVSGPFHKMWRYWLMSVMHLRDIPDCPPATILTPGATHQFNITSIAPEIENPVDTIGNNEGIILLSPPDLEVQYKVASDTAAIETLSKMVSLIMHCKMSPDSDCRHAWSVSLPGIIRSAEMSL